MFIVIEMQTTGGVTSTITTSYENENEAYQKFYQICSFAAVSTIDIHSACILNDYCGMIKNETFIHTTQEET